MKFSEPAKSKALSLHVQSKTLSNPLIRRLQGAIIKGLCDSFQRELNKIISDSKKLDLKSQNYYGTKRLKTESKYREVHYLFRVFKTEQNDRDYSILNFSFD